MRTENIRFQRKEDFLKYYLEDVYEGGILWITDAPVNMNEEILLNIRFAGWPKVWSLKTFVLWRNARPPGRDDLPEGVGLAVSEESLQDFANLLAFCRERDTTRDSILKPDERANVRFDVPYLVEFLYEKKLVRAALRDISESGCYIETDKLLPELTRFVFFMYRPHKPRPWVMEGEVRWTRSAPPKRGMGIKFLFDTRRHKAEVRKLINKIERGEKYSANIDESSYSTDFLSTASGSKLGTSAGKSSEA